MGSKGMEDGKAAKTRRAAAGASPQCRSPCSTSSKSPRCWGGNMDKAGNGDIIGLVGQLVGCDISDSMQRHRNLEVSQISGNSHHLVTIDGTPGSACLLEHQRARKETT